MKNSTWVGAKYIGERFESFQAADGTVSVRKLYAYENRGERRYALTEAAARTAVADLLEGVSQHGKVKT
jgi:hypothetical protein